ncbi:MAG: hybrid sensor histidine kinase/response regulator [Candidatus Delongbacteria bacterium]|nr:hybrid sensor histidine kinase/response regulator [Candidatus Delongbacteria bacterium]
MVDLTPRDIDIDQRTANILIVDDEELTLNSLRMILERYFTVFTTLDPTEVALIIENNDIDLLISDEMMPGMRGCELVEKIHNEHPDITKIILSGNSDKKDIVRAVNKGHIFSFLFKPVDASQLIQVINQGLEHKKMKEKIKLQNLVLERTNETLIQDVLKKSSKINEMEKFYEIGKFSASIVHNLNSPLQTLITGYQLLEDEINKNSDIQPQIKTIMQLIDESFIKMEEMIRSITLTAKDANLVKNIPVSLNDVIITLVDKFTFKLKYSDKINFYTDLDGSLPNILGIRVHFDQIFSNLIKNAIDAVSDSEERSISIKSFSKNDRICTIIEDTGCGISEKYINKIFETGFTTKEFGKGSGLGLMITKQMVNSYKGEISVMSELGKGSSFLICFPK